MIPRSGSAGRNPVIFTVMVSLTVILAAVLTWQDEFRLLFSAEGFRPTIRQVGTVACLFIASWVVMFLLASALNGVRRDYENYLNSLRRDSSPLGIAVESYEGRGFVFHSRLGEVASSAQVWVKSERELDAQNVYRQSGALIYPDGSATQFSIAVLYRDDVWNLGDEINVRRRQVGRPVTIRTALNRQLIRELIQSNDYVLGVGLASSSPTRAEERNENLAHARAFNIGYAIQRLDLQTADRIYGLSLGYAMSPPPIAEQEPIQRAVVIIGVNASRDVLVADVVAASARVIALDGLDLSQYSRAGDRAVRFRWQQGASAYIRAADVRVESRSDGDWILPAIVSR